MIFDRNDKKFINKLVDSDKILVEKLYKSNYDYRINGESELSDLEYDQLYNALKLKYPYLTIFNSIGMLTPQFGKDVQLEYKMGSLRNKHLYDEITSDNKSDNIIHWLTLHKSNDNNYVLMDKIDGLSILVTWEDGKLSHAELRGDGDIGTDCTEKVRHILKDFLTINIQHKFVCRGEISIYCDPNTLGYKTKRNGSVGIMKRFDLNKLEFLDIFFYEIVDCDNIKNMTITEQFNMLKNIGLSVVNYIILELTDVYRFNIPDNFKKLDRLYDIDGHVICPNNYIRENKLLPDGKVAIKPQSNSVLTKVTNIEYDVSRHGKYIPVIHVDEVIIDGVTINKATGFNCAFIKDNRINISSIVYICRSQEVVPYIKLVVSGDDWDEPLKCKYCGNDLQWDDNCVHKICDNYNCPPRVVKRNHFFFTQLGLEDFSIKTFEKLSLSTISDIFNLTYEDILGLDGFAEKSAKALYNKIQDLKNIKPEKILAAYGIENMGNTISKLLVNNFNWDDIINVNISKESLTCLDGIGSKMADTILNGLQFISEDLNKLMEKVDITVNSEVGLLNGKMFCITGKLSKPRKEIEKWIEENGGDVTGLKNKPGMYLVCNNPSTSSKYLKAQKENIPIITEEILYNMI